ncbi:MAG: hypothetical protein JHC95_22785, partial [Solirubrobacteraceae bacterium]|nr:hypothetical protein [Solirubrobacteraceae bacterium]
MFRRPLIFATTLIALLGAASSASAATTHHVAATSDRSFLPCSPSQPCRLDFAMLAAQAGDDVALAPGDYRQTATLPLPGLVPVRPGVTVHGTPGKPLPVIHGQMGSGAVPFVTIQNGGALSDVDLRVGSEPGVGFARVAAVDPGGLLDKSIVRAQGTDGVESTACAMFGGRVRSTACLGEGAGTVHAMTGIGSGSAEYSIRNVTAITTATAGQGLRALASSNQVTVNVSNTIFRGIGSDLAARAGTATGRVTVNLDHSNWSSQETGGNGATTIAHGAGNQNGPSFAVPLFTDAAQGDYRPLPTSPTIDAGGNDFLNGTEALGGDRRTIGPAT